MLSLFYYLQLNHQYSYRNSDDAVEIGFKISKGDGRISYLDNLHNYTMLSNRSILQVFEDRYNSKQKYDIGYEGFDIVEQVEVVVKKWVVKKD